MTTSLHAKVVEGVIVAREQKDDAISLQSKLASDGGPTWRPIVDVGRDDPVGADQIKEGPVETIEVSRIARTWTIRALTAQEITNRDTAQKQDAINAGALQLAIITIKLVDNLIAKGTIAATDFDVTTRAEYLDLKTKVEALRA